MGALRRFAGMSSADRKLIVEATILLATARAGVRLFPLRWIVRVIGLRQGIAPPPAVDRRLPAQRIALAILTASRRTPWKSNCLTQALAGCVMLKRRGIASTLYLGVAKDTNANLEAHAWLCSHEQTLTGGGELGRYTVVASFAAPAGLE